MKLRDLPRRMAFTCSTDGPLVRCRHLVTPTNSHELHWCGSDRRKKLLPKRRIRSRPLYCRLANTTQVGNFLVRYIRQNTYPWYIPPSSSPLAFPIIWRRRNGYEYHSSTLSCPVRPPPLTPHFPYLFYTTLSTLFSVFAVSFLVSVHLTFFLSLHPSIHMSLHSKNRLVKKTTNLLGWPNIGCFNQYIG